MDSIKKLIRKKISQFNLEDCLFSEEDVAKFMKHLKDNGEKSLELALSSCNRIMASGQTLDIILAIDPDMQITPIFLEFEADENGVATEDHIEKLSKRLSIDVPSCVAMVFAHKSRYHEDTALAFYFDVAGNILTGKVEKDSKEYGVSEWMNDKTMKEEEKKKIPSGFRAIFNKTVRFQFEAGKTPLTFGLDK